MSYTCYGHFPHWNRIIILNAASIDMNNAVLEPSTSNIIISEICGAQHIDNRKKPLLAMFRCTINHLQMSNRSISSCCCSCAACVSCSHWRALCCFQISVVFRHGCNKWHSLEIQHGMIKSPLIPQGKGNNQWRTFGKWPHQPKHFRD